MRAQATTPVKCVFLSGRNAEESQQVIQFSRELGADQISHFAQIYSPNH